MNSKHSRDAVSLRDSVQIRSRFGVDNQLRNNTFCFVSSKIWNRVEDSVFSTTWRVVRSTINYTINVNVAQKL